MRIRWANVVLFLASVAGLVWALSRRWAVSEFPRRLATLLEIDEQLKPVFAVLGVALLLALAIRLIRDSRSGGDE